MIAARLMKRALVGIAVALATIAIAHAQEKLSSQRLYWLCQTADPQCVPLLRQLVTEIIKVNPDCRYYPISDERLRTTFLQVVSTDQSWLRFSPLTVETNVFSLAASNCVHRMPDAVAAEMAPWTQREAELQKQFAAPRKYSYNDVQGDIRRLEAADARCKDQDDHQACKTRDELWTFLRTKRDWCFGHEPQPMGDRQWEPCRH